jgi:hypothetical protein
MQPAIHLQFQIQTWRPGILQLSVTDYTAMPSPRFFPFPEFVTHTHTHFIWPLGKAAAWLNVLGDLVRHLVGFSVL